MTAHSVNSYWRRGEQFKVDPIMNKVTLNTVIILTINLEFPTFFSFLGTRWGGTRKFILWNTEDITALVGWGKAGLLGRDFLISAWPWPLSTSPTWSSRQLQHSNKTTGVVCPSSATRVQYGTVAKARMLSQYWDLVLVELYGEAGAALIFLHMCLLHLPTWFSATTPSPNVNTCFLVPYSSISKALCPNNPFLFIKCLSQNTDNRHTAQTRCMGAHPHLPHHHRLLRGTHPHASVVLGSWVLEPPENGLYGEWILLSESPERPWNFFGLRIQKEKYLEHNFF